MPQMGDTSIEYAIWAAEIAYGTRAFSPRSEIMRTEVVKALFTIVKTHYNPSLTWEQFWKVVEEELTRLQAKEREESGQYGPPQTNAFFDLSIAQLFDVTRTDTT